MQRVVMAVASASLIATLAACRAQAPSTPPADAGAGGRQGRRRRCSRRSARFAPTDLTADITALPPNEREALAHMVRAAQVMDALFLEQVWAGNEAHALQPDQGRVAARQGAAARLPGQQGAVVAARSQRVVRARRAGEAGVRQLLSRRRDQGGSREVDRHR